MVSKYSFNLFIHDLIILVWCWRNREFLESYLEPKSITLKELDWNGLFGFKNCEIINIKSRVSCAKLCKEDALTFSQTILVSASLVWNWHCRSTSYPLNYSDYETDAYKPISDLSKEGVGMFQIRHFCKSNFRDKIDSYTFTTLQFTLASKWLDYQFLATLYEKGQGIPRDGDEREGRKGC